MELKLKEYNLPHKFLSDLDNVSLNFGPVTDVRIHSLEQVYIANIFKFLVKYSIFKNFQFYILSANSEYNFKIDKSSIVFYLSNEDHSVPDNILKAKAIFTPYCPLEIDKRPANCFPIPLGYNGSQVDLPIIDMESRINDTFFSGNIHKKRIPFFLNSLIFLNRRKLLNAFNVASSKDLIYYNRKFTGGLSAEDYSNILMNTKIALVPEGYMSDISFRFFEATRFGCVVITPKLYNYWFFKDFPGIQIDHWGQLHSKVNYLFKNPSLFLEIQKKTLQYYKNSCSEEAVSKFVLKHLQ